MAYDERRVVADERVATGPTSTVRTQPETVVEQRPRTVISEDPVGNAFAASQLIQTIVWLVVVLVLLVVGLWALHVYANLF